jgi:hydroxymethylglutaryl-CoA lyase
MTLPKSVIINEVGPRDGLQNESIFVPTPIKIELINSLSKTGLKHIETTSFVSPKAIPQLADSEEVYDTIQKDPDIHYTVLVPNEQGLARAMAVKVKRIAIFASASESFSHRNINCSIDESLKRYEAVVKLAKAKQMYVRAYLSCVLGCPYEGDIDKERVATLSKALWEMGVDEIALGDTIGIGTAHQTKALIKSVSNVIPIEKIGMHFHDTYGQALTNIYASLECGIAIFDSSIAGLGGCPYAKGASGNVSTEDVLYLLHGLGIETGIDLLKLVYIGNTISTQLHRANQSKVGNVLSP